MSYKTLKLLGNFNVVTPSSYPDKKITIKKVVFGIGNLDLIGLFFIGIKEVL